MSALNAFEAASRHRSFRRAAEELHLSPSAVSHAIRRLEARLGTALFERDGRAVHLTGAGEVLMRHVARGFAELHAGMATVGGRGPQLFRLHCAPSFAAQWLAPRLPRLLAQRPNLEVRLHADANYSRFSVDEYEADIVYGLPRKPGLVVVPLGEEVVAPLCAPALAAGIGTPADLLRLPLIQSDNKMVRWADWFAANGMPPPPLRGPRFDRSFLSVAAAADGMGVALESTRLAERELASGRLVQPLGGRAADCRYVGHYLVYLATRGGPILAFRDWLLAELDVSWSPSE